MEYKVIRSNRKTIAIEVKSDGSVVVRAPLFVSKQRIESFVTQKQDWIQKTVARVKSYPTADDAELKRLRDAAKAVLPQKVAYYARLLGVTYGKITVRHQKTRWGSCSAKGNLSFNCMLMTMPERVIDYVVVHELCHRKQMNHSPEFWNEVSRIIPDYKELRKQLR